MKPFAGSFANVPTNNEASSRLDQAGTKVIKLGERGVSVQSVTSQRNHSYEDSTGRVRGWSLWRYPRSEQAPVVGSRGRRSSSLVMGHAAEPQEIDVVRDLECGPHLLFHQ